MKLCPTCGRSLAVTDDQIHNLVERLDTVLLDLGSRLGYTNAEIMMLVNNAKVPS